MMLRAGVRRCSTTTLDLIRRDPFKSALVVTTAKTVAADLLVQLAIEGREWEPRRTTLFAAFGFAYQGAVQYCVVNVLLEGMFPGQTARAVAAKCALMNGVADPFFFLPTFYIFKETIRKTQLPDRTTVLPCTDTIGWPCRTSPSEHLPRQVSRALARYRENCLEDIRNSWMLWIPGHVVTYGMMPPAFRLPWMSILSFGYVGVLSVTRGSMTEAQPVVPARAHTTSTSVAARDEEVDEARALGLTQPLKRVPSV